eukprot:TRINITY_DN57258_c0_g1_i1.p1 TRINITY_DN57258_c0_g1~~TRINITY_DN57258_c0_g1_i1.p1  ORF type:complete len:367 (-),score=40.36 TRINITY_DN57258_c0_g1_i1:397-1497(-)
MTDSKPEDSGNSKLGLALLFCAAVFIATRFKGSSEPVQPTMAQQPQQRIVHPTTAKLETSVTEGTTSNSNPTTETEIPGLAGLDSNIVNARKAFAEKLKPYCKFDSEGKIQVPGGKATSFPSFEQQLEWLDCDVFDCEYYRKLHAFATFKSIPSNYPSLQTGVMQQITNRCTKLTAYLKGHRKYITGFVSPDKRIWQSSIYLAFANAWFNQTANGQGLKVCEIGFNGGHSAIAWLEPKNTTKVLAFDCGLLSGTKSGVNQLKLMYGSDRLEYVNGLSTDTVPQVASQHAQSCDLISIDGSHNYPDVVLDIPNMQPYAHKHTVVVMDDMFGGVLEATWERWCQGFTIVIKLGTPHRAPPFMVGAYLI